MTAARPPAVAAAGFLLLAVLPGCVTTSERSPARPWASADALFRSDPRWLGADAAYSVPLDGERVLWLFGDTFIGDGKTTRRDAAFIRNSVAIQSRRDVRKADISFHWGRSGEAPDSFFPATTDAWLWPVHGVFRNDTLTLFFTRVSSARGGLGFKLTGAAALRCVDISGPPESWRFESLALPNTPGPYAFVFGVAVLEDGGFVYAFCDAERDGHKIYLLRWSVEDFDSGRLPAAQWWNGTEFVYETALRDGPALLFDDGATEFSVHRLPDGRLLQVQSLGFPQSHIGYRTAPRPEGPWSTPERVYLPPESKRSGTLVYAAKAHPELISDDILVTYAANHFDAEVLLRDTHLYYPRFVRLRPPPN